MSAPASSAYQPPARYQPPPPRSTWFSRHGKTVIEGAAVVGGVIGIGALVYVVVDSLIGGQQPPACTDLQNELYSLQQQLLTIYQQAAQQGGTFSGSQASEIQSLNSSIANVVGQLSSACVASPGTTLEKTIDQIISYGLWAAAIAIGLTASAFFIRWAVQRWGGPVDGSETPPTGPDDVDVPDDFQGAATGGADAASGEIAAEYEAGQISSDEAEAAAANIAATDPAIGLSSTLGDYFAALASEASEAAAVILDAFSALWYAILDTLEDVYAAFVALFGL